MSNIKNFFRSLDVFNIAFYLAISIVVLGVAYLAFFGPDEYPSRNQKIMIVPIPIFVPR